MGKPIGSFRFSLRFALLMITASCCAIGWWVNRAHIQRSAVAKIVEAGGEVEYTYYFEPIHNDAWVHHSEPRTLVPRWVREALGDDYFSSVIGCKISYDSARPIDVDRVLGHVARLTRLRFLDLQGHDVTDVGIAHIRRLRLLEKLDLNGTRVSDGLRCVTPLALGWRGYFFWAIRSDWESFGGSRGGSLGVVRPQGGPWGRVFLRDAS